jgi:hypothetical protein
MAPATIPRRARADVVGGAVRERLTRQTGALPVAVPRATAFADATGPFAAAVPMARTLGIGLVTPQRRSASNGRHRPRRIAWTVIGENCLLIMH